MSAVNDGAARRRTDDPIRTTCSNASTPSGQRLNAKGGEQSIVHGCGSNAQRPIAGREVHLAGRIRANDRERLVQLPEFEVLRRRDPELVEAERGKLRGEIHQLVGLWISERPQDHAIDDREDGGIGADAERQGQDGDERERRRAQQAADGVAKILAKIINGHALFDERTAPRV